MNAWANARVLARLGIRCFLLFGLHPTLAAGKGLVCACSDAGRCRVGMPGAHPRRPAGYRQVATIDPDAIAELETRGRNAGCLTGVAGLIILEVEAGPGEDALRALEHACGPLPAGPISAVQGRRWLWLRASRLAAMPESRDLATGLRLIARGGFVVVPGSLIGGGDVVTWTSPPAHIPRISGQWLEALAAPEEFRPTVRIFAKPASVPAQ